MKVDKKKIIIISGPSGVGKNSIALGVIRMAEKLERVVTCTSRTKRPQEVEGKDYYFISEEEFNKRVEQGDYFLEYERTHGFMYGTPKSELDRIRGKEYVPVMVIDVKGGLNLMKMLGQDKVISIFILPESKEQLKERIKQRRGKMDDDELKRRMKTADYELGVADRYGYRVVNRQGKLKETIEKVIEIING